MTKLCNLNLNQDFKNYEIECFIHSKPRSAKDNRSKDFRKHRFNSLL